jgi:hypothetical protein
MKRILILGIVLALPGTGMAEFSFSVDPASPAINGDITPDDVLYIGPIVAVQGADLLLQGGLDNLDAVSNGRNPLANPVLFSVDRVAVGLVGSDVSVQSGLREAHGDVYLALPPLGNNRLLLEERQLGLTPGFFGDDTDALEPDLQPDHPVYFSIDSLSASNVGALANDIFVDLLGLLFASGETHVGLDPLDDLDALALDDSFQPGVLNPGIDRALFSLSKFSPSAFTVTGNPYIPGVAGSLSPGDILLTDFTGHYSLWASAAAIGLLETDELDGLATVPEPASLLLFGIGLAAWARKERAT